MEITGLYFAQNCPDRQGIRITDVGCYWMFSVSEGSPGDIGRSFRQIGPTDLFKFRFKAALATVFPVAADHNHFSKTNSGLRIMYLI